MSWLGDFHAGVTIETDFTTVDSTGLPTALAGGTISVYKDQSTTESTSGVTLTASFDARTGMNHVTITCSSDTTFYVRGSRYRITMTAGTVSSVSMIGYVVGEFSIGCTPGVICSGTAQSATSTTLVLQATETLGDGDIGWTLEVTSASTGAKQRALVTGYVASSKTATLAWSGGVTPTGTITYTGYASAPGSTISPAPADVRQWVGGTVPAPNVTGVPLTDLKYTLGTISPAPAGSVRSDAVTGAVGSVTGAVGSVTGAVGSVTGAVGSVTGAVGSVTGAVGSVTGNVGGNVVGTVASVTGNVAGNVTGSIGSLTNAAIDSLFTRALTEAYSTDGSTITVANALYEIVSLLEDFAVSGTTVSLKKRDGTTVWGTLTLNSATVPTSTTRAT